MTLEWFFEKKNRFVFAMQIAPANAIDVACAYINPGNS